MNKNIYIKLAAAFVLAVAAISCQSVEKSQKEEPFKISLDSMFIQIGEIESRLSPFMGLGKIRDVKIQALYFPVEDAVVLKFRHEATTFHQCWDRNGRQSYIEALEKYKEEYKARALVSGSNKTKRNYGLVTGYLIWQQISIAVRADSNIKIELGYTFKERTPYFLTNQLAAEYISPISRTYNKSSPVVPMYFTGPQAEKLAELFNHDFLKTIEPPKPTWQNYTE